MVFGQAAAAAAAVTHPLGSLAEWLAPLNLGRYHDALAAAGYDELNF
eukprot:COSAG01_NODE_64403_length_276_cov_1.457627_1_plen_46_part_01